MYLFVYLFIYIASSILIKTSLFFFFTFSSVGSVFEEANQKPSYKIILEHHPSRVTLRGHLLRGTRAWERATAELCLSHSHFEQIQMTEARTQDE